MPGGVHGGESPIEIGSHTLTFTCNYHPPTPAYLVAFIRIHDNFSSLTLSLNQYSSGVGVGVGVGIVTLCH